MVSCLPYPWTLRMEATCSSEKSQKIEIFLWKNILVIFNETARTKVLFASDVKIEYIMYNES
jgi:hypothetical protein